MANTRRILSKLGYEAGKTAQATHSSAVKSKPTDAVEPDRLEKKLTLEAISQLCMHSTEEKQLFPDQI